MFNLNFDEGRPIAFINGGDYDKEILYLNSNKEQFFYKEVLKNPKFWLHRLSFFLIHLSNH